MHSTPDAGRRRSLRHGTLGVVLGWSVVALVVLGLFLLQNIGPYLIDEDDLPPEMQGDSIGLVMIKMQGRYLVGASQLVGAGPEAMLSQAEPILNTGPIPRRLRFVVLAGELIGPARALDELDLLDMRVVEAENTSWTEDERQLAQVLRDLYLDHEAGAWIAPSVDSSDRALLIDELEWFGELALAPDPPDRIDDAGNVQEVPPPDPDARARVLTPAQVTVGVLFTVFLGGALLGICGLIGLIILLVMASRRRLKSGIQTNLRYGGVYIETFAVWMLAFLLLTQTLPVLAPQMAMGLALVAFFLSLSALAWPVIRGVPWSIVRRDIGWTRGRSPAAEPFIGLGGYAITLPCLGVGLLMTFLLIAVQGAFHAASSGQPDPVQNFSPGGGPAHPIVGELGSGSWLQRISILLVAAVAAPIVEETMFRGVLYAHLRNATARWGFVLSFLFSALLNGLMFAMIHPQGWVAIPALMGIAFGMTILREWRGTLIPSIVIHGVSNGIVTTLLLIVLGL